MNDAILLPLVTGGLLLWAATYPIEWAYKLYRHLNLRKSK